jgi:hypothetical protein
MQLRLSDEDSTVQTLIPINHEIITVLFGIRLIDFKGTMNGSRVSEPIYGTLCASRRVDMRGYHSQ